MVDCLAADKWRKIIVPEKCICQRDADIERLNVLTDQNHRDLRGNGNEGVVIRFAKLETEHEDMCESVDKLATAFSALAKSDSNRDAVRKALGRSFVVGCAILSTAGMIITIILSVR